MEKIMKNNNITEEFVDGFYKQNEKSIIDMLSLDNDENEFENKPENHFEKTNESVENERKNGDVTVNTFIKKTPQHNVISNNFVLMFMDNFDMFLEKYELTNMEFKVLAYILKEMKHGNLFNISQKYLAKRYGTSQSAISRYIKNLIKKGIIIENERGSKLINSSLFMKGNIASLNQEARDNLYESQKDMGYLKPTIKEKKDNFKKKK